MMYLLMSGLLQTASSVMRRQAVLHCQRSPRVLLPLFYVLFILAARKTNSLTVTKYSYRSKNKACVSVRLDCKGSSGETHEQRKLSSVQCFLLYRKDLDK